VVAKVYLISVILHNGVEAEAEVIGTDPYSDLAVIQVEALPLGAHPLPLGNSDSEEISNDPFLGDFILSKLSVQN
jgi:S1-C subfamily serine protease